MKKQLSTIVMMAAAAALCVPAAIAQETTTTTPTTSTTKPKYTINQRKQNQQERIGEGVENGSLTAGETAHIEKQETRLNKEEKVLKSDGSLSAADRAKLQSQQNKLSKEIYNQKHDAQTQNLNPKSEVGQRQLNQQQRIGQGIENGSLNSREAARLETRETAVNKEIRTDRKANGGTLTGAERRQVNRQENKNSRAIYRQKHDRQHR